MELYCLSSSSSSSSFSNIVTISDEGRAKLKNLITYGFGFLINVHLKPLTPTLEEGRIIVINGGVDFSCK